MSRRAYGPQRKVGPATRAKYIAESILTHNLPTTESTWERYGIQTNTEMQQLVYEWIYLTTTKP